MYRPADSGTPISILGPSPSDLRGTGSQIGLTAESLDAVRRFLGADDELSHVPEAARAVLARFDGRAAHHEVIDRRPQAGDIA